MFSVLERREERREERRGERREKRKGKRREKRREERGEGKRKGGEEEIAARERMGKGKMLRGKTESNKESGGPCYCEYAHMKLTVWVRIKPAIPKEREGEESEVAEPPHLLPVQLIVGQNQ